MRADPNPIHLHGRPATRRITTLIAVFVLLTLVSCSSVVSVNKLGEPLVDEEVGAKFDGLWASDGGAAYVKHLGGGELVVASLDWNEQTRQFEKQEMHAWLTTDDDVMYVNILQKELDDDAQANPPTYAFLRCAIEDKRMVLIGPVPEYFAKAVEDGRVEGTVEHGEHGTVDAVITSDAAKFVDLVHPVQAGAQFNVDKPIVLRKLSD